MNKLLGFKCINCENETTISKGVYVCPHCGGNLQVVYDYQTLRSKITREKLNINHERSIWRYADILPIRSTQFAPPVQIGWTPLYASRNLGHLFGLTNLFIKDDGRNPSASFKDRAGAIIAAHALEQGEHLITGASTGNAASSMACLASALKLRTIIFVPHTAPAAKVAQLLVFGATVISVKGTYDEAFDLCLKATAEYGWYNRNTGYNPYTREGKKTCSFEIIEQLGMKVPDWVFVSVGDGNIISGLWKGFKDFYALGIIDRLPRLAAIQAEKSNAVKAAFESNGEIRSVSGETVADSISVSIPRDGQAAVKALKESKGMAVSVSDKEILEAIPLLARAEGVFAEPAGAATIAGLRKAAESGKIKGSETVVTVITGNGLKDIASAMKTVSEPYHITPDMESLRRLGLDRVSGSL